MAFDGRKRKRVVSVGTEPANSTHLPHESINPLSYTPGTLRQFSIAGLSEVEAVPTSWIPRFPHRPFCDRKGSEAALPEQTSNRGSVESEVTDSASNLKAREKPRIKTNKTLRPIARGPDFPRELHRRALRNSVHIFLQKGEITKARHLFSVLIRSTAGISKGQVDLRYDNYWSLGAEILMRDGEEQIQQQLKAKGEMNGALPRLGLATNITRVRSYFQTLILRHPYVKRHSKSFSSLHFYPALWGYEIYNVYIEHKLALDRLWLENQDESDDHGSFQDGDSDEQTGEDEVPRSALDRDFTSLPPEIAGAVPRRLTLNKNRDQLRRQALERMTDITGRMDGVMEEAPFSKSPELLRLRGMASLYVSDLRVSIEPNIRSEIEDARAAKEREHAKARRLFTKVRDMTGFLDAAVNSIVRDVDVYDDLEYEAENSEGDYDTRRHSSDDEDGLNGRRYGRERKIEGTTNGTFLAVRRIF